MKVLIACEFSGIVREAFRKKGHDAWSCDLLDTEIPGQHYKGDVLDILGSGFIDVPYNCGDNEIYYKPHYIGTWDLIIAHPPCTYFANSGVRWLYEIPGRGELMLDAAVFFNTVFRANVDKICMENPIPHRYAVSLIGKYNQIIQPWQFGHPETKATCLWLKNLPELKPTNIVDGREGRVHKEPPGPDRWKNRSRTYQGIANAMAEQWG